MPDRIRSHRWFHRQQSYLFIIRSIYEGHQVHLFQEILTLFTSWCQIYTSTYRLHFSFIILLILAQKQKKHFFVFEFILIGTWRIYRRRLQAHAILVLNCYAWSGRWHVAMHCFISRRNCIVYHRNVWYVLLGRSASVHLSSAWSVPRAVRCVATSKSIVYRLISCTND
jgi:hypothetical protein